MTLAITVTDFPTYSRGRFDLWVALHAPGTPDTQFSFISGLPTTPAFSVEPIPFSTELMPEEAAYTVLDNLAIPVLQTGIYTFYALLTETGVNPLQDLEKTRSDLAIQTLVLR